MITNHYTQITITIKEVRIKFWIDIMGLKVCKYAYLVLVYIRCKKYEKHEKLIIL